MNNINTTQQIVINEFEKLPQDQKLYFLVSLFKKLNTQTKQNILDKISRIRSDFFTNGETQLNNTGKISKIVKKIADYFLDANANEGCKTFMSMIERTTTECKENLIETIFQHFEKDMMEFFAQE